MPRYRSEVSRGVVACGILVVALVAGGMLMQSGRWRTAEAAPASSQLLDEVMTRVQRDFIDSLTRPELRERAATGLVLELDDPNSVLLSRETYQRLREQTTGEYAGVGLELDERDGAVMVIAPFAGTPADSADIRPGDRLVSIDGRPTAGMNMDQVEQRLRGAAGTRVRLRLERDAEPASVDVPLTRRSIRLRAVQHAVLMDGGVGYVRFAAFSEQSAAELSAAVDSLRGAGMLSLILDLRHNPGGLLDEGVSVADLFLDAGATIVSTRGRSPRETHEYEDQAEQRWSGLPVVALVDSGTASAAEIVAGALQDHRRAVIVGAPTYGKGSAQAVLPVAGGRALKLTTARWYTPDGRSIQRDSTAGGITPDVVVRDPGVLFSPEDAVVRRAASLLNGVRSPAELRRRLPRK